MTEPDNTTSPFARRGFIAAAVVVALVVVAAVVVAVTGGDDSTPAPQAGGAATAPATTSAANSGECDQPEGSQTPPVAAPDNDWELVGRLAAPTAPDGAGPGNVTDDGLRTCFAHDPTGALFAAVNWLGATTSPELAQPAAEELTAEGPGRDVILAALAEDPSEVIGDDPGGFQVAGFTFAAYTGDYAMVSLALGGFSADGQVALPVTLQWSGTDWQVQLPANGRIIDQLTVLPTLAGYVPWSGA